MPKFTFISEDELNHTLTMTTEEVYLTDILLRFEEFLRGSGFHFTGSIEIHEPDKDARNDETDQH